MAGPQWSDANGWAASPVYYSTIRVADVDGDGNGDVCGRASDGWHCNRSLGAGSAKFGADFKGAQLSDPSGWAATAAYSATIMSAGPVCRPVSESCNGRDDDCDGQVDDGVCIDAGSAAGGSGGGDELPLGTGGGSSAGTGGGEAETVMPDGPAAGGCGCQSGGPLLLAALVVAAGGLRRRAKR